MTYDAASGPRTDSSDAVEHDATPAIDPAMTLAQYAETAARSPQPAATTLAALQERSFTGQVTFATDPAVRVYFDRGTPYFAERDGDRPISGRLLDEGVVSASQVERGTVRVGDVENLGRLFDRDDSVDRDAVMVVVESSTDCVLGELATTVSEIQLHSFRHHPSGIHRWFVTQVDSTTASRPVSDVAQVDRSVVDELPALGSGAAHLRIEWDTADDDTDENASTEVSDDSSPSWGQLTVADEVYIEAELNRFDADQADWSGAAGNDPTIIQPVDDVTEAPTLPESTLATPADGFQILWPDGTEQPADSDPNATALGGLPSPGPGATPVAFEPPKIVLDHMPEPDEEVPVDVADAVRQALAAIETTTVATPDLPTLEVAPAEVPEFGFLRRDEPAPPAQTDVAPSMAPPTVVPTTDDVAATAPTPATAFAPPTVDTRAEVMYAKAAAQVDEVMEQIAVADVPDVAGTQQVASTDEYVIEDDGDRAGALRRLIGSLRRKD